MSKREDIVRAAKALIWETGYEGTSPRDVMERSGAAEGRIAEALAEARTAGQLREDADPRQLALTLVAVLQGGYLLARAHHDPTAMHRAIAGAMSLLEGSSRHG